MILYAFKRGVWDPLKAIVLRENWRSKGAVGAGVVISCGACGHVVAWTRTEARPKDGRPKVWLQIDGGTAKFW